MKLGTNGLLIPDRTYTLNGVTIYESIIPNNRVWLDDAKARQAGFKKGDLYKACRKLSSGTGKIAGITVHNTYRMEPIKAGTTHAEQYCRATYYENMGATRVHYYVDDVCAWQNIYINEVGWHAGDGTTGPGNGTTVGIEVIMDETKNDYNKKTRANAIKLIAYLMDRYDLTIDNLYTHQRFINLKNGLTGSVDFLNTHIIPGVYKQCPLYILPEWKIFKQDVLNEFNKLRGIKETPTNNSGNSSGNIVVPETNVKASANQPYFIYTIQSGDYWYKLARDFNVNLTELLLINNVSVNSPLYPNQQIKVPTTSTITFEAGNKVQFKSTANVYFPDGPAIPNIMKNNYYHIITRIENNGQKVFKGGEECVLLGQKIQKTGSTKIEPGINTWVSKANIEKIYN